MGALGNLYLKEEVLETLLKTIRAKKEKGVSITFSINDTTNEWGQNVSSFVSQTKEQREQKVKKFYVGNGAVTWVEGEIKVADKVVKATYSGSTPKSMEEEHELPF